MPLPEFQLQPLHHSNEEREEALQIEIFFIVLYYCEMQMYANGYCCVYRKRPEVRWQYKKNKIKKNYFILP